MNEGLCFSTSLHAVFESGVDGICTDDGETSTSDSVSLSGFFRVVGWAVDGICAEGGEILTADNAFLIGLVSAEGEGVDDIFTEVGEARVPNYASLGGCQGYGLAGFYADRIRLDYTGPLEKATGNTI